MTDELAEAKPAEMPWWWSTDQERYRGPCGSRADAILEAWAENPDSVSFHVMQADHGEVWTAVFDSEQIGEAFDELNCDQCDPDGDPLSAQIPADEWTAIAGYLARRIKAAVRKHGVVAWSFSRTTEGEWVNLEPALMAGLPPEAQSAISDLISAASEGPVAHWVLEKAAKALAANRAAAPVD